MEENRRLEKMREMPPRRREEYSNGNFSVWHLVGGLALVGAAVLLIANAPDIKRYIKISTM